MVANLGKTHYGTPLARRWDPFHCCPHGWALGAGDRPPLWAHHYRSSPCQNPTSDILMILLSVYILRSIIRILENNLARSNGLGSGNRSSLGDQATAFLTSWGTWIYQTPEYDDKVEGAPKGSLDQRIRYSAFTLAPEAITHCPFLHPNPPSSISCPPPPASTFSQRQVA